MILICETIECGNAGYEIEVQEVGDICVCGVCGQVITNKR